LKIINGKKIETAEDWEEIRYDLLPNKIIRIKTDKKEYVFQVNKELEINVKKVSRSNIRKGLDLEGGTRVLLEPVSKEKGSDQEIKNLIEIADTAKEESMKKAAALLIANTVSALTIASITGITLSRAIQGIFPAGLGPITTVPVDAVKLSLEKKERETRKMSEKLLTPKVLCLRYGAGTSPVR